MALKLNGKEDRRIRLDFTTLARTIGLTMGDAQNALIDLMGRVLERAKQMELPVFAADSEQCSLYVTRLSPLLNYDVIYLR